MSQNLKGYSKALVIFVDILGSKNRTSFDELYEINDTFHSVLLDNKTLDKDRTVYKRTIHTFSDCAYIIYDFKANVPEEKKDLGKLFEVALCNCEPLFIKFLDRGFIFRGGIAYGDVYYEGERSLLFGSAINAAYKLENEIAQYPRIVVENFVAETILVHWNKTVEEMDNPQIDYEKTIYYGIGNPKRQQGCVIRQDYDSIYMMHYLNSIETKQSNLSFINKMNEEFTEACLSFCKQQIDVNNTNPRVVQKYGWLINYILSSCPN